MSQTPNLDAARASLQQAIDQANAIVKPIIDAMREAGMLTPAPQSVSVGFRQSDTTPAAAPAVDDELLRDRLIAWLPEIRNDGVIYYPTDGNIDAVIENVVLPIVRERDDLALRLEGVEAHRERLLEDARTRDERQLVEVARLRRERADALALVGPACSCVVNRLAESHDGHCCVAGPGTESTCHQSEVEAYRSLAEAREALGEIGELVDPWMGFDGFITDGVKAVIAEVARRRAEVQRLEQERAAADGSAVRAAAEVARLRAAQQLPDDGPLTRRCPATIPHEGHTFRTAALFGCPGIAEAADTSSDDEVDTVARVLLEHGVTDDEGHGTVAEVATAVRDALRARGGQEAGPRRCRPDCGCLDGTNVRVESGECAVFDENGETRREAGRDR